MHGFQFFKLYIYIQYKDLDDMARGKNRDVVQKVKMKESVCLEVKTGLCWIAGS